MNNTEEIGFFSVGAQTGRHQRTGLQTKCGSRATGWRSCVLTHRAEIPYALHSEAAPHGLVILHLSGPVRASARIGTQSKQTTVEDGAVTFLPPGQAYQIEVLDRLQSLHLRLDRGFLRSVAAKTGHRDLAHGTLRPILFGTDDLLKSLMIEMWRQVRCPSSRSDVQAEQLVDAIALRILRSNALVQAPERQARSNALSSRSLKQLADYIAENLDSRIAIDDLATMVGYSASHFFRSFKATTGKSPYRYVLEQRIEKSKDLLCDTDIPIVTIALNCGFSDQEHFSHTFRKYADTSPLSFRTASRKA